MSNFSEIEKQLETRLGRVHARLRLGIESESGHKIFGSGVNFFHPENWYSTHSLIKACLKVTGFYQRGVRNARNIQVRHNDFFIKQTQSLKDKMDGIRG